MHYSTREFWKVKGIHKIFIFFSRSKKRGMVSFWDSSRKAVAGGVGRIVAIMVGAASVTAVKLWRRKGVTSSVAFADSFLSRGSQGRRRKSSSFAKKPSPRGEGGTAAAVTDEVGRESLRQPIRSAAEKSCCIIRGGRTLNFGASVGGLRLRGANSFIITAVKLRRGVRCPLISRLSPTASPQGEARELTEQKNHLF